jgi:hypothetical protein
MIVGVIQLLFRLIEVELPIGGHGYDFSNGFRGESEGDDDEGGIPTFYLVAAGVITTITLGVVVALDPSGAIQRMRRFGPKAVIVLVIAAPLVAWTIGSQSESAEDLIVERWTALDGAPELLVSLGDKALNSLATTKGKRAVRVKCVDRDGKVVIDGEHKWPFVWEKGFDYAHAHQPASRVQLLEVDRCTLLGPQIHLEAGVKGALTG